jgi:hypothetical protein
MYGVTVSLKELNNMLAGQDAKMKILGTSLDESNISVVDN